MRDLDHENSIEEEHRLSESSFPYHFPSDECGLNLISSLDGGGSSGMPTEVTLPTKATAFMDEGGNASGDVAVQADQ